MGAHEGKADLISGTARGTGRAVACGWWSAVLPSPLT
ncbi:hypothetical protein M2436_006817 [Streptomyces sp. HB372]|nr:hypothetical protein [Streptomyces sp. HB372]